jgi:NTE family protein
MKNILLILLFCQQLYAQNTIKNLVFEGAGVRGIAYAGAIKELENNKLISQIEKVGGTSAGAITAMMIDFIGGITIGKRF